MKIVYIAHPIGGDVVENIQKVLDIVKKINLEKKYVVPFAPYITDVLALDDDKHEEREIGLRNCYHILSSLKIDELWLYGPRVTSGMLAEVELALEKGMPVYIKDPEMEMPLGYEFIERDCDEDNEG
jgi:hypothetical protein